MRIPGGDGRPAAVAYPAGAAADEPRCRLHKADAKAVRLC